MNQVLSLRNRVSSEVHRKFILLYEFMGSLRQKNCATGEGFELQSTDLETSIVMSR
jgi:hypothetical protein